MEFVFERLVEVDVALFTKCLCSVGLGGCTNEMLRVCLDDHELFHLLFRAVEDTVKGRHARVCEEGVHGSYHDGVAETGWRGPGHRYRHFIPSVRGENVGPPIREQHAFHFSSPFRRGRAQIAWATQSGHSRIRSAFLKKIAQRPKYARVVAVRSCHVFGYVWEDEGGTASSKLKGASKEILLFSLAIYNPLEEASRDRTRTSYDSLGEKLFTQAGIRSHRQDPSVESCIQWEWLGWDPTCGIPRG